MLKRTEVMTYNNPEHDSLRTVSGDVLKEVDFKYLGHQDQEGTCLEEP